VFAYDATTGALRWSTPLDARVRSAPSVRGGQVYVATDAATVWSLDASSGAVVWTARAAPPDANAVVRSSPALAGRRVIVTTGETTPMDGHVVAFDAASGTSLWRSKLADYSTSSVAIANGVAYLGSYDTRLYAIDARNGSQLWTSGWGTLPRGINSSPAIANGKVFVGVRDGSLYAFGLR
jgi:outer membrane protein assembly factor BamB